MNLEKKIICQNQPRLSVVYVGQGVNVSIDVSTTSENIVGLGDRASVSKLWQVMGKNRRCFEKLEV